MRISSRLIALSFWCCIQKARPVQAPVNLSKSGSLASRNRLGRLALWPVPYSVVMVAGPGVAPDSQAYEARDLLSVPPASEQMSESQYKPQHLVVVKEQ